MAGGNLLAVHPDPATAEDRLERRRIATPSEQEQLLDGVRVEAVLAPACGFANGAEETKRRRLSLRFETSCASAAGMRGR